MTIERVTWTAHAELRVRERGLTFGTVEMILRDRHTTRTINAGDADWRIDAGRCVVIYDHPDGADLTTARIISVWLKRGQLSSLS